MTEVVVVLPEAAAALAGVERAASEMSLATLRADVEGGSARVAITLQHQEYARRVAAGLVHVIEDVRFGRGRLTTCAACEFTCTGPDDEAMAATWRRHAAATNHWKRTPTR